MKIRVANKHDVPALQHLVNEAYRPAGGGGWTHESNLLDGQRISQPQLLELLHQPDSLVLVGEGEQQELQATVLLEKQDSATYIGMLSVLPGLQTQGIGKQMLAAAEACAVSHQQAQRLVMTVLALRHELIAFYLRRGYRHTGRVIDFPVDAGVGVPKVQGLTFIELEKLLAA